VVVVSQKSGAMVMVIVEVMVESPRSWLLSCYGLERGGHWHNRERENQGAGTEMFVAILGSSKPPLFEEDAFVRGSLQEQPPRPCRHVDGWGK